MRHIRPNVLILTAEEDATADFLTPYLDRAGLTWCRWDSGTLPSLAQVGARFSEGRWREFEVSTAPTTRLLLEEVGVIWLRRPTLSHVRFSGPKSGVHDFVEKESAWFLQGLWSILPVPWVNHPDVGRLASYKPRQLEVATQVGFSVPRTYIGNDPRRVMALWEECDGHMVVKSLHRPHVEIAENQRRMLYTTPVSLVEVKDSEAIRACPSIWQEYVRKDVELRVTVVGEKVFAAEIDSQASKWTQHDWRRYDPENVTHCPHDLPEEIRSLCVALLTDMELNYAAIDLVLTPEGRYVFLEINPFGQWAWIEQLCNLPIAEAHCQLFATLARR